MGRIVIYAVNSCDHLSYNKVLDKKYAILMYWSLLFHDKN